MNSDNVTREWQNYLDHNKLMIPVLLRPTGIHFQLANRQYVDFTGNYSEALRQLNGYLKKIGLPVKLLSRGAELELPAQPPLPVQPETIIDSSKLQRRSCHLAVQLTVMICVIALLLLIPAIISSLPPLNGTAVAQITQQYTVSSAQTPSIAELSTDLSDLAAATIAARITQTANAIASYTKT